MTTELKPHLKETSRGSCLYLINGDSERIRQHACLKWDKIRGCSHVVRPKECYLQRRDWSLVINILFNRSTNFSLKVEHFILHFFSVTSCKVNVYTDPGIRNLHFTMSYRRQCMTLRIRNRIQCESMLPTAM